MKPGTFTGLIGFTAKCGAAVRLEGDEALVLCAYHQKAEPKSGRVRLTPDPVYARVIGRDAEQAVWVLEVSARQILDAVAAGTLIEAVQ